MGEGSSTLCMLLQLSTANGGRVVSSTFHIQWKSHHWGGWVVGGNPPHFTSRQSPISGGRVLHIAHTTSTLNCWWGRGRVGSSTFHIQTVTSRGVGIFHISHPKLHHLVDGWVISSTFHNYSITSWGWLGDICHISHPARVTSSGGWGILHNIIVLLVKKMKNVSCIY